MGGGIIPAASVGCVVCTGDPGGRTDGLRASAVAFMARPTGTGTTFTACSGAGTVPGGGDGVFTEGLPAAAVGGGFGV